MNTSESITRTLSDAYDDLRSDAREAAGDARRTLTSFTRALPYAALGTMQENFRRSRRGIRRAFDWPGSLLDRARDGARHAPERIRETYWARAESGEDLVDRAFRRKSAKRARKHTTTATRAAKRTANAARKAATAGRQAVADAASSIDPNDTRTYEERTVDELYALAAEREIDGRSQMNKGELIAALRGKRS